MRYYEHHFSNVEDYLHHRAPYLMVDRIISCDETSIVTEKKITGDEFFLAGHFPGAPIFPGAMQQEFCTQSAGILIAAKYNPMAEYNTHDPVFNEFALGVLVKINRARFYGFARPGDTLKASIKLNEIVGSVFDFSATVRVGEQVVSRIAFQLTNVHSSTLTGTQVIKESSTQL
jgi:3-hydroxyacyl-[acyl-carrier-protein] dehydratase